MTDKKIVFLSHISEERELAVHFKSLIEDSFLDLIDVFVSSDDRSIGLGQKWLDDITHALNVCTVELVLCSPVSVKRPWINFEAGAGWIRGIPVVPLCHSGMEPGKLPIPLNLLQAAKLTETSSLKLVFPVLANALGSRTPTVDFSAFIQNAVDFEKKYTFWNSCNSAFQVINNINPQIIDDLRNQNVVSLDLVDVQIAELERVCQFLQSENILMFKRIGHQTIGPSGVLFGCEIQPLPKLSTTFKDTHFIFHK
ncbi:toll/interleukin-1 receptor domain-containing protein [Desulfobacter sp.]|uniref:toll/interleukin-1 receptor domain-containing protein n=1 Tax=Desulfobacter sp. TaxID=2294 RepID=UPI003D0EAA2A